MLNYLKRLWKKGDIREVRAWNKSGNTLFGYFDSPKKIMDKVRPLFKSYFVCITLNPCDPRLLFRVKNRLEQAFGKNKGVSTKDAEIERVDYFFVDIDADRPKGISASMEEVEIASQKAQEIYSFLGVECVCNVFSGNGYHLIYELDKETTKYQRDCALKEIYDKFNGNGVIIDRSVTNSAQLIKIPGSSSRKGENTEERPWRPAKVLFFGKNPKPLDLSRFPKEPPKKEKKKKTFPLSPSNNPPREKFDLQRFLSSHGIRIKKPKPCPDGVKYELEECVFDSSHNRGESMIVEHATGLITYFCHHNSCKGKKWEDVREYLGDPRENERACDHCGEEITWIDGNTRPYNLDGTLHTCLRDKRLKLRLVSPINDDNDYKEKPLKAPQTEEQEKEDIEIKKMYLQKIKQQLNPARFPVEVLPDCLQNWVLEVKKSVSAPIDYACVYAICIASALIGGDKKIKIGDWEQAPGLYTACIGRPGSGKSPMFEHVKRLIRPLERRLLEENEKNKQDYKRDKAIHQISMDAWKREYKKGKTVNPPVPPEKKGLKAFLVTDTTIEALIERMSANTKLAYAPDEIAFLFNSLNQYKGGKGNDRQALLSFWSGSMHAVDRQAREDRLMVEHPFLSIAGGIQPDMLDTLSKGKNDGLLDRFLVCWPRPVKSGASSYTGVAQEIDDEMKRIFEQMYMDKQMREIELSQEAFEYFRQYEKEQKDLAYKEDDAISGWRIKSTSHLLRIALVLEILDCTSKNRYVEYIRMQAIWAASVIVDYFRVQQEKVLGKAQETVDESKIKKVIDFVNRRNLKELTSRKICQSSLFGIRKSAKAKAFLTFLEKEGLGELNEKGNSLIFNNDFIEREAV